MGKKNSLTEVQRAQIVILHNEGASKHQIAVRLSVSKTEVHQAITEHVSEEIFCDRKRSGIPRKTSIRDDNQHSKDDSSLSNKFYKETSSHLTSKRYKSDSDDHFPTFEQRIQPKIR